MLRPRGNCAGPIGGNAAVSNSKAEQDNCHTAYSPASAACKQGAVCDSERDSRGAIKSLADPYTMSRTFGPNLTAALASQVRRRAPRAGAIPQPSADLPLPTGYVSRKTEQSHCTTHGRSSILNDAEFSADLVLRSIKRRNCLFRHHKSRVCRLHVARRMNFSSPHRRIRIAP